MSDLIDDLQATIEAGEAVVVAGAGVARAASGDAQVASWPGLLAHGIDRCAELGVVPAGWSGLQHGLLGLDDVGSWISVAEQITDRLGGAEGGEFNRWLRDTVGTLQLVDSSVPNAIAALNIPVATTNYDGLLEAASGCSPTTWRDGPRSQRALRGHDRGVVHLHGYWDTVGSIVLGIRSYDRVLRDASAQAMLRALATMRSLIFVGFGAGLQDPNFCALRQWMGQTWAGSEYRHFRIVVDSDLDRVRSEHAPEERIASVSCGASQSDLASFLDSLGSVRRSARRRASRRDMPPPTGVPGPRHCFGRDELLEDIVEDLLTDEPRPIPILGPPGIGKSAISLASAHDTRVVAKFDSRRYWVRCDGSSGREELLADIADALGQVSARELEPAVLAALGARPALLILDNVEVPWALDLAGVEDLLTRLAAIPELALVCSFRGSERPLGPRWRSSVMVPPLEIDASKHVFLAAAGERFASDQDLYGVLTDLDGMPIAIELLGWLAHSEPGLAGLRRRWERKRTDLLSRGSDPDRHLSVAVSFELSIGAAAMTADARRLLSVLALLPDGVATTDLDKLERDEAGAVLRRVGLSFDEGDRLRVLKPIRDHVARHHAPSAEDVRSVQELYLDVARSLGPQVGSSTGDAAIRRLSAEAGNLRWAIEAGFADDDPTNAIVAAIDLQNLGRFTGLPVEPLIEGATQAAVRVGKAAMQAKGVFALAALRLARSDHERARKRYAEALRLFRQIGDVVGESNCVRGLGTIALERSDFEGARQRFDESLSLYRQVGVVVGEANCLHGLGTIAVMRSNYGQAQARFKEALPLYRQAGAVLGHANCVRGLGFIALRRSDYEGARDRFKEALPLYRQVGDLGGRPIASGA